MRDQKSDRQETDHTYFAGQRTGHHYISFQQEKPIAINVGKKKTMQKCADNYIPTTEQ